MAVPVQVRTALIVGLSLLYNSVLQNPPRKSCSGTGEALHLWCRHPNNSFIFFVNSISYSYFPFNYKYYQRKECFMVNPCNVSSFIRSDSIISFTMKSAKLVRLMLFGVSCKNTYHNLNKNKPEIYMGFSQKVPGYGNN